MSPSNKRRPQIDAAPRSSVKKINAAAFNQGNTVNKKFWSLNRVGVHLARNNYMYAHKYVISYTVLYVGMLYSQVVYISVCA